MHPPSPSAASPPALKWPKHDPRFSFKCGPAPDWVRHLDTLWVAQAAAQEASGVMAAEIAAPAGGNEGSISLGVRSGACDEGYGEG